MVRGYPGGGKVRTVEDLEEDTVTETAEGSCSSSIEVHKVKKGPGNQANAGIKELSTLSERGFQ